MRKRLFGIMASVAVIAAACGGASTSSAPPAGSTAPGTSAAAGTAVPSVSDLAEDQTLRIDIHNEPPTLDPTMAQDQVSIQVLRALTRPLVYFDKDLKIVPQLAEKWEVSTDAKTITFHLRDAKYSNGDPIVAADFVYSWKRLADPRLAAPYSYVMAEVAGAPELAALPTTPAPTDAQVDALLAKLGVAAPDAKTFVVTLNTPATYFLAAATLWVFGPIQEKWITAPNATEAANFVSSGPYIMESWQHKSEIVLKPNPNWYGDKSKLSQIVMGIAAEPAQSQAAFEAQEIDMVAPPVTDIRRIQADPVLGPLVLQIPTLGVTYYDFNYKKGPTTNKDFRIALTQAIDKKTMIDTVYSGVGTPAASIVMPGLPGYQKDLDPYPYDPAAAKAHMATALKTLGVASAADLGKLKLGFNTAGNNEPLVAFMAESWRSMLGVETTQIAVEWKVFLKQRDKGEFDIARDGWGADYPHANNQLSGLFTCAGGGNNGSQWCNKDFDGLLTKAAGEPDQDKQVALYNEAQTLMINDAPVVPLRFGVTTYEVASYVGGVSPTGADVALPGDLWYEDMFIKQH